MLLHTDLEFTGSGLKSARSTPAFRLTCDEIKGEGMERGSRNDSKVREGQVEAGGKMERV